MVDYRRPARGEKEARPHRPLEGSRRARVLQSSLRQAERQEQRQRPLERKRQWEWQRPSEVKPRASAGEWSRAGRSRVRLRFNYCQGCLSIAAERLAFLLLRT